MEDDEEKYPRKKGNMENAHTSPLKGKISINQTRTSVRTRKEIITRGSRGR